MHLTLQVLKIQPKNAKALYRRGIARLHIGVLDGAEDDLLAANSLNPNGEKDCTYTQQADFSLCYTDKEIKLRLQELSEKRKDFVEKEKEMYSAMFTKN